MVALPHISCVALGELLNFSVLQSPHSEIRDKEIRDKTQTSGSVGSKDKMRSCIESTVFDMKPGFPKCYCFLAMEAFQG